MPSLPPKIFADLPLARRLERAEATACASFVDTRATLMPESNATWIEVAGAYAMFDGVASPITQTFGLGIFEPVTTEALDQIEHFFLSRGAAVQHEVSPLADPSTLTLLKTRGYQPIEFSSVLYRSIGPDDGVDAPSDDRIRARSIESTDQQRWADVFVRGWAMPAEMAAMMSELALVNSRRRHGLNFLVELGETPIAAGSMMIHDGVALLAGASTVPEHRKRGGQLALLGARLSYAVANGCDVAMMGALPGSGSQRNAERHGFRIAYTRTKWELSATR